MRWTSTRASLTPPSATPATGDLQFHGAHRRGFDNCLLCHGISGAEDWPQFKTADLSSLETPGVSVEFREMLHKIHHGRELAAGDEYVVVGFRGRPHTYEEVGFPSFQGGTANCDSCHGADSDFLVRAHRPSPPRTVDTRGSAQLGLRLWILPRQPLGPRPHRRQHRQRPGELRRLPRRRQGAQRRGRAQAPISLSSFSKRTTRHEPGHPVSAILRARGGRLR